MAIAVHGALALVKRRERRQRQWHQRRSLHIGEMLADLAAGGAMDPGVGDGQFPVQQEDILLLQSGEASCLEGIALDVVDAFFDFSLVTRRARSRGPENESVVFGEGADLGIELGIEPVGLLHGSLEVIQDEPLWCSAKVAEVGPSTESLPVLIIWKRPLGLRAILVPLSSCSSKDRLVLCLVLEKRVDCPVSVSFEF